MVTGDGKRPWWSCAIRLEACAKYRTKAEVEDAGPISQLPSGCPPKSTLLDVSTLNVGLASDWKEQVVDRLRLRLVSRRATQLTEALERRHGERWSEHVKAGGFHVDEAMRRICEASLPAAARTGAAGRTRFSISATHELRIEHQVPEAASECSASPSGSDGEQPATPSRPGPLHKLVLVEHSFEDGPGSTRSTASTASFGSLSSPSEDEATTKDPSDLLWQEIDWLMDSTQRHCLDGGPKMGRAPWLQRALRTLDLDPPGTRCATPPAREGEEEDEELSRKLVTAIINAERHAELSETLQEVLGDEGFVDDDDDDRGPRRQRSIDFQDSDIRFFVIDPQGEAMGEEYCRALHTKAFDGPSGHKARKASCSDEGFDSSDDESDEEEEDWKDQCDEMADLMGQQRQMVLWRSRCHGDADGGRLSRSHAGEKDVGTWSWRLDADGWALYAARIAARDQALLVAKQAMTAPAAAGADEADAGAATREAYNHFADDALDYGTGLLLPARYASDAEHSEAARNAEGDA
eukprot:s436_g5.t1